MQDGVIKQREYKPTKKEVFSEMWDGFKHYNVPKIKGFTNGFLTGLIGVSIMPYLIPTTIRLWKESKDHESNPNSSQKNGAFAGMSVASGAYEIGREKYKEAEKNLIYRHNRDLESTLNDDGDASHWAGE